LKNCPRSLVTKEMQTKMTVRFHLTQSEWLSSRKQTTTNAGEDVEKKDSYKLLMGM
jgi:hypothetical protein